MLSLKDFKEVKIGNDFSIKGGACTGGGGQLMYTETRTVSTPGGPDVQSRNVYMDWTSDDGDTKYGIHTVYGDWY